MIEPVCNVVPEQRRHSESEAGQLRLVFTSLGLQAGVVDLGFAQPGRNQSIPSANIHPTASQGKENAAQPIQQIQPITGTCFLAE